MRQNTNQNETSNTSNYIGNFNSIINNNNTMSAQQRLSQGGVGLFDPIAAQRQQQQQGLMNGMLGNANAKMTNVQAGAIANNMNSINAMNNMNGMMNNMNYANGNGNFNGQHSIQANMNQNAMNQNAANLNNFNVNDFMRLQQQLQQQQLQQQMQQQMQQQLQQQQQLQAGSSMNNAANSQNMNYALMAAQHNQNQQNQPNNNAASNNNLLQSFIGRNPQFAGAGGLVGQGQAANAVHQNPFLGHLMQQQQNAGLAAGLVGHNNGGGAAVPPAIGGAALAANNAAFQFGSPATLFSRDASRRMRGGVIEPFPEKLHRLLLEVEAAGRSDVISFVANGRAFAIHKADSFFKEIVPLYFRQSRLSSFKRQLNLYGFELINTGPARGGYYHEMFVKERPELCRRMRRVAVKVAPAKDGGNPKRSKTNDKPATATDDSEQMEEDDDDSPPSINKAAEKEEATTEGAAKTGEDTEGVAGDAQEQGAEGTTEVSMSTEQQVTEQLTEQDAEQVTEQVTEQDAEQIEVAGEKSNEESAAYTSKTSTVKTDEVQHKATDEPTES
jgi:hypothetical protein